MLLNNIDISISVRKRIFNKSILALDTNNTYVIFLKTQLNTRGINLNTNRKQLAHLQSCYIVVNTTHKLHKYTTMRLRTYYCYDKNIKSQKSIHRLCIRTGTYMKTSIRFNCILATAHRFIGFSLKYLT